ncbi:adenylate/guanylate cyclase domain-containing protein [Siphonobacter aquaeclarae]|uniref:Adenylate cyclase n=1 Tax=Siphonobacter aquaeclarae TaxID=563176 RepID=A0A1G9V8H0_9BACT|nr:adenylate/guanylate cyclase domain-containing protein [Siphonobacter aquaeclarae]MBO9637023.1 adenylate/guanylate cyclase domain-containing protein [Siphonobacter aquaeclarae]SDM68175.1 adenylate cyclase [Siphonobacter aquaeclarae]
MSLRYRRTEEVRPFFAEQFRIENLRREQQRAALLATLFAVGTSLLFLFRGIVTDETLKLTFFRTLIVFLVIMAVYEWGVYRSIGRLVNLNKDLPLAVKFVNAAVEVTAVTLVLYISSEDFTRQIFVMISPLASFYFFFIILSTLRLSLILSVFTGLIAAVEYTLLSLYFLKNTPLPAEAQLYHPLPYVGKGTLLFLAGFAAGYVARQINKSIRTTIESMESQNQLITIFGQQVSPEVAEVIVSNQGHIESARVRVAVMFLDIREFTAFAEKHTAEEVVAYQNAFFSIIVGVVTRHHGIVNQFLGDGCMVSFGAPAPVENPSAAAVASALDILAEIQQAVRDKQLIPTRIGIGVHVGEAVSGNLGTELRQQYSLTGSVVIQSTRIESLNKEFGSQILVSQQVLDDLTASPAGATPLGAVHLKGMEEEVFLWKLA